MGRIRGAYPSTPRISRFHFARTVRKSHDKPNMFDTSGAITVSDVLRRNKQVSGENVMMSNARFMFSGTQVFSLKTKHWENADVVCEIEAEEILNSNKGHIRMKMGIRCRLSL